MSTAAMMAAGSGYGAPTASGADSTIAAPSINASGDLSEQRAKARRAAMTAAYNAYCGDMPAPLKVKPGNMDDNAIIGLMRPIVETGVSFLFGKSVTFDVETAADEVAEGEGGSTSTPKPTPMEAALAAAQKAGGSGALAALRSAKAAQPPKSPEQQALDLVWRANHQSTFLKNTATNGALFGHVFVKTVPNGVQYKGKVWPRLILLDSTQMEMLTDPDDMDVVTQYVQTWAGVDDEGQPCTRRQRTVRADVASLARLSSDPDNGGRRLVVLGAPSDWEIIDEHQQRGGMWVEDLREPWPYKWCPIHDAQNLPEANSKWGAPNITAALIRMNQLLNFLVSNATRIAKHHAHPKPWTAGATLEEWRTGIDEAINMASSEAKIGQLEMTGNGLADLLSLIDTIRDFIDELSHVPGIALGRLKDMPRGGVSGIALELMFAALLEQTEDKRELYGDLLDSLNGHLLEMCGFAPDINVNIIWPKVLPQDVPTMAPAAVTLLQAGISQDSVIQWLGWNPDEEAEKNRIAEAVKAALAPPPAPVQVIAAPPAGEATPPPAGAASSASGQQPPAGNLNHPAMQQQRALAAAGAR